MRAVHRRKPKTAEASFGFLFFEVSSSRLDTAAFEPWMEGELSSSERNGCSSLVSPLTFSFLTRPPCQGAPFPA
jgi:hypothetical protein